MRANTDALSQVIIFGWPSLAVAAAPSNVLGSELGQLRLFMHRALRWEATQSEL